MTSSQKKSEMKDELVFKLQNQLEELEANMVDFELTNEAVSSASVGWHIEHSLLVIEGVIETLKTSDPKLFKKKFNLKKKIIYLLGKFPRGKARAPKSVRPSEQMDKIQTEKRLDRLKLAITELLKLDTGVFFKHPIFGNLRLLDSVRFLELHTEHHLKIIRGITVTD